MTVTAHVPEADDAQSGWRHQLEIGSGLDSIRQVPRQRDILFNRRLVAGHSELLHRHPDLQRPEAASLLKTVLAEPGETIHAGRTAGAPDVRRHQAERVAHRTCVADDHEARLHGHEHPFVRVESGAVGAADRFQRFRVFVRQDCGAAIGGVHVHPDTVTIADAADGGQIVDCSRVGRARGCDHSDRADAVGDVAVVQQQHQGLEGAFVAGAAEDEGGDLPGPQGTLHRGQHPGDV